MTELVTAAEMKAIEAAAMASGGVTGIELMERAGAGVVEAILREWPERRDQPGRATVLCGPGNNGGDGFVVARRLADRGWSTTVLALPTVDGAPDARLARKRWEATGAVLPLDADTLRGAPDADIYVDALFGIGLTRPVEGPAGGVIRHLAGEGGDHDHYRTRLVAVDVPSGLCADSGRVPGWPELGRGSSGAPFARLTVTFESPKPGHYLGHGPALCGRLAVVDIGIARWRETSRDTSGRALRPAGTVLEPPRAEVSDRRDATRLSAAQLLTKAGGHKYAHGHVVVVSGGAGRTGAARLAARGALRIGAGLVTVASPGNAMAENAHHLTAIMLRRTDDAAALSDLLEDPRLNALCLGPGLGAGERTRALVEAALAARRATVLDADAPTSFEDQPDALFDRLREAAGDKRARAVLTPHDGEFRRLFPDLADAMRSARPPAPLSCRDGADRDATTAHAEEVEAWRAALAAERGPMTSKVDVVREAATRAGAVVLLKGPDTVVASPDGRVAIAWASYERAAPWLATAGAGDVLAGFITGLLARGLEPFDAARIAARVHVDCALRHGPGLVAEDLPEALSGVLRDLGA